MGRPKLHVRINRYQQKFLDENHFTKAEVVREKLDDFMLEQGADPDEWERRYGTQLE